MRVLVYGLSTQLGGVESFFINYYRAMKNNNLDITCDSIGVKNCVLENEIKAYGGKCYGITGEYKNYIKEFFKKHHNLYDLLWANLVDASDIEVIKAAKKSGIKVIVHSHSSSIMVPGLYGKYRKLRHLINRELLNYYSDEYWACSDLAAKWMFSKRIINQNKDRFIPNAIDAKRFRFNSAERRSQRAEAYENQIFIGYIGRFSFEKNPIFAVKIFQEIQKKNQNSKLLMFGDGEMLNVVKDYIKEKEINNVELLGVCKDIDKKMQILDCVIIPSLFEGMPMVALEAQAAGLHVFASGDNISKQTKIVSEMDFIKLSDGPEIWANAILKSNLGRRDTFHEIVKNGFEINSASITLYNYFLNLINLE